MMAVSKLLTLIRTLTSGVQDVLVAVRDVRSVNRVLEKIGKDDSFNSQDLSSGYEIENFKHSLREAVILTNRFIVASKSLAKYSSNEGHVQQIKEDLSAGNSQKLKPYLDGVAGHLSRCRVRVEEFQAEYSKLSEKARQLTERRSREQSATHSGLSLTEQDINYRSNIAGVAAAILLPGTVALMFREFGLFFLFVYACFGIGGFVLGKKGTSMLLTRSSSAPYSRRRAQGIRQYNSEIQLQSVKDSIATFLAKAPGTRSKLLQLEQCVKEASECIGVIADQGQPPAHKFGNDSDKFNELKTQLSELQHKMSQLLKCVDEESDTEQYSAS